MHLINPDWGPDPLNQLIDGPPRRRPLARYQIHDIFREMVRHELADGELSVRRRRKLVRYAASLQLSATEAGELIQEAVRAQAAVRPADPHAMGAPRLRLLAGRAPARGWPITLKLLIAVAAALLLHVILTTLVVN
ncbi:MAG TPA: hypothetical protein VM243_01000 [Phycisphaerae bacterium]|nr:hypothetical protein [Phycisphaerae bacterium]